LLPPFSIVLTVFVGFSSWNKTRTIHEKGSTHTKSLDSWLKAFCIARMRAKDYIPQLQEQPPRQILALSRLRSPFGRSLRALQRRQESGSRQQRWTCCRRSRNISVCETIQSSIDELSDRSVTRKDAVLNMCVLARVQS
jgi:hypothetical protein